MVVNDCETLNMTATLLGWATSCTNSDSRVDVTITQTSCGGGDGSTCADAAVESANVLFERTYATGVDAWIKIAKTPITNYSITIAYVSGDVPSIEVYDGDDCAGKTLTDTISYSHAGRCVDETGGAGAFWWLKITAPASDTVLDLTVSTTPC
jgi:hypothetical protein